MVIGCFHGDEPQGDYLIRKYLDKKTNVLSEPGKVQIQMMEGDSVIRESINFLNNLAPLPALEWDENLAASAAEHVNDIGPIGALSYQSSDGTEPEDRISKYGSFTDSLGENIDFGPNDALGVIISLTLDDGEEDRPHRDNLFKADYRKVGIACGAHKTEFQMCVMDFAYDFIGHNQNKKNNQRQWGNNNYNYNNYNQNQNWNQNSNDIKIQMSKADMMNNSNFLKNQGYDDTNLNNNTNPCVKLSIENEEFVKGKENQKQGFYGDANANKGGLQEEDGDKADFDELVNRTKEAISSLKIVEKKVEIETKITYVYDDGSTKEVTQVENHSFKY